MNSVDATPLGFEVKKVDHYWLKIDALTEPIKVCEETIPYGD